LLKENPVVNSSTLALELNRTRKTVTRALKELKDAGFIKRIGSDKTGYWEVLKR
jgi:ATP-dependent DNA helicase RecG